MELVAWDGLDSSVCASVSVNVSVLKVRCSVKLIGEHETKKKRKQKNKKVGEIGTFEGRLTGSHCGRFACRNRWDPLAVANAISMIGRTKAKSSSGLGNEGSFAVLRFCRLQTGEGKGSLKFENLTDS
jgi:hypothetical protein